MSKLSEENHKDEAGELVRVQHVPSVIIFKDFSSSYPNVTDLAGS